jgi:hypothetical protein
MWRILQTSSDCRCVNILIHVCVCVCVCVCACVRVPEQLRLQVCEHRVWFCVYVWVHAYMHIYTYMNIHTYIHTYMHTYIHTYIHIGASRYRRYIYGLRRGYVTTIQPTHEGKCIHTFTCKLNRFSLNKTTSNEDQFLSLLWTVQY